MEQDYDELFVIILGDKQKRYKKFDLKKVFQFDGDKHIINFKDILKFINKLTTIKIERIRKILEQQQQPKRILKSKSNAKRVKRNLALKKRLKKDLLEELDKKFWRQANYEPWIRFKYHNILVRSVDDNTWSNAEETKDGEMSPWFKGECWDLYDNGLELISMGREAIIDKDGNWDLLNLRGDDRVNNSNYKKIVVNPFLRIPYDFIIDYNMEADPYNAIPSLFVEYAKDGMPYEEIIYGVLGHY